MTQPSYASQNGSELPELRVAIHVDIPSDVRYIERVVELVTKQCEDFHFPSRHCTLNVRLH
jgi:hypothetical protein